MLEPFPSMSRVYSLVLQEKSHKHLGHGAAGSSQLDTMAMYTNSKGNSNSNWNKGNGKKERPFCTHCNMQGVRVLWDSTLLLTQYGSSSRELVLH